MTNILKIDNMDNFKLLSTAIIEQAIFDVKNIEVKQDLEAEKKRIINRKSAQKFFKSDWFDYLCFDLNIDSDSIKDLIKNYL